MVSVDFRTLGPVKTDGQRYLESALDIYVVILIGTWYLVHAPIRLGGMRSLIRQCFLVDWSGRA